MRTPQSLKEAIEQANHAYSIHLEWTPSDQLKSLSSFVEPAIRDYLAQHFGVSMMTHDSFADVLKEMYENL